MNRNFAKPRKDMTPEFAPDVLVINGRKVYGSKAIHCKIAGYKPLSPDWPVDPPQGKHYERTDKIERDGDGYRWVYTLVDNPPPPQPVYDRYKLVCALETANLLLPFVQFLEADPVLKIKWDSAQQLDYDDDVLTDGIAALKTALGVTDEQIAAVLAASVKEGV